MQKGISQLKIDQSDIRFILSGPPQYQFKNATKTYFKFKSDQSIEFHLTCTPHDAEDAQANKYKKGIPYLLTN